MLKFRDINDLKIIVEKGDASWVKDGEIVGFSENMKKAGHPNYLSKDKDLLIVASADIEGGYGLPLYSNALEE